MTAEQHALFPEPSWTDRLTVGDRVRNRTTGNTGTVREVVHGRHVLIDWDATDRIPANTCRHGSPMWLTPEED